jgi:hypothetical protein
MVNFNEDEPKRKDKLDEPYDARVSRTVVRPAKVDISNGCKSHQRKSQSAVAK